MPLDFTPEMNHLSVVPEELAFNVAFEDTKVEDKRYVINDVTGEYVGIVGKDFNCEDHENFFYDIQDAITDNLTPSQLEGAKVDWKIANKNTWALMDITLPNVTAKITTNKHETEVAQRIIALHGIDGSCSNQVYFGAIDFFCTNGMIRGEHDKVRRKNTTNFNMNSFIRQLNECQDAFYRQTEQLQHWAKKDLSHVDVLPFLEKVMKPKAEKMYSLYNQEVATRGRNLFSLYSAFTNYATYADERNGFNLRNTGYDTGAKTMFGREHQVSKWVNSTDFKVLEVA